MNDIFGGGPELARWTRLLQFMDCAVTRHDCSGALARHVHAVLACRGCVLRFSEGEKTDEVAAGYHYGVGWWPASLFMWRGNVP